MPIAATLAPGPIRQIVHRSRGRSHGFVTRLMSPGDLGRILKPFVFLDLVDNKGEVFPAFGLHPHSGLATLTYDWRSRYAGPLRARQFRPIRPRFESVI